MRQPIHKLELLSPAREAAIGREAILHGADAVYIGGPSFGARHNAGNSLSDIAALSDFAHRYGAKIFVTLNTILHDNELEPARRLIHRLYDAGVDALIVQDMGILQMDIPPIDLHASTQCDIRSVEKARFLSQAGFSQIVLARELSLPQIAAIRDSIDANIEFFIHGALCVAYSGQCYISHAQTGRSANRGDCSQACRLPYTLKDEQGRVVAYEKHLLSLKDNDQSDNLTALIDAGVRSFKIEGRYKDMSYVKNITAYYRQRLDVILDQRPELCRASLGRTRHFFTPSPDKTFHRGSTDYFVRERQIDIGAFESPKFIGVPIGEVTAVTAGYLDVSVREALHNGDGLNVQVKRDIVGLRANTVEAQGKGRYRIWPNEMPPTLATLRLPHPLNRNLDHDWQQALLKSSSERRIGLRLCLSGSAQQLQLTLTSEDGVSVNQFLEGHFEPARQADRALQGLREGLSKLGQTLYQADEVEIALAEPYFIPNSQLNQLRREAIEQLDQARARQDNRLQRRAPIMPPPQYPQSHLTYLDNVYNRLAREFYHRHGVTLIDAAYEAHTEKGEVPVMITKHCLRFAFNLCPKQAKGIQGVKGRASPMQLVCQDELLTLKFDCKHCEMQVIGKIKPHVLKMALPGSVLGAITPDELLKTLPGKENIILKYPQNNRVVPFLFTLWREISPAKNAI
ncbi:peptidase U32 family protein [Edwardsiella ictaluri]